jgi:cell wall-associated NlpC family hydrolase
MGKVNLFWIIALVFLLPGKAMTESYQHPAVTASIDTNEIASFDANSKAVKTLIVNALALTRQNLTYCYASADPKTGCMDCSGTIYFLLRQLNISAPRPSNEQFLWVKKYGKLHLVTASDLNSQEFSSLQPGNLLFWEGTYDIKRYPPSTHVMIYLGKDKQGRPLMVGASDGRTYRGNKMWGVSVFDFKLPAPNSKSHFIGYSCIPNYSCG